MWPRQWPRLVAALLLGVAGAAALAASHAPVAVALLSGAAAFVFVEWKALAGVLAAFALGLLAAGLAWSGGSASLGGLRPALAFLLALELYGLLTIAAVARVRDPVRVSRRLLGSWLATTDLGLMGLALCAQCTTSGAGSALIAAALAYRLGVAPAYAWVPLQLRHPDRRIKVLGALGLAVSGAVLALTLPRLPDQAAAGFSLALLGALTLPWAAARARAQWRPDPACARTFLFVASLSVLVLAEGLYLWTA